MAFVGNACRLPEGATAGDIPRGLRANGGLGPARLVERRGPAMEALWEPPPHR